MRVRDCPSVEVARLIEDASPERVWALVTDITLPTRHPGGELQAVEWCDGFDAPAVSARFRGTSAHPALGTWTTTCEVVEFEPLTRFVWRVLGEPDEVTTATWGFEVDPSSRGTIVRQWARMGPGASGLAHAIEANPQLEGRIVAKRLEEYRDGMTANLDWLATQPT